MFSLYNSLLIFLFNFVIVSIVLIYRIGNCSQMKVLCCKFFFEECGLYFHIFNSTVRCCTQQFFISSNISITVLHVFYLKKDYFPQKLLSIMMEWLYTLKNCPTIIQLMPGSNIHSNTSLNPKKAKEVSKDFDQKKESMTTRIETKLSWNQRKEDEWLSLMTKDNVTLKFKC